MDSATPLFRPGAYRVRVTKGAYPRLCSALRPETERLAVSADVLLARIAEDLAGAINAGEMPAGGRYKWRTHPRFHHLHLAVAWEILIAFAVQEETSEIFLVGVRAPNPIS